MNGDIIHIGDSVQYFDFNKQILVQTKKEMHSLQSTVVNWRIIPYCRSTNNLSYMVFNINNDNLFLKKI